MPPPTSRQPGYSKKAQYSVFTGYLVAGIGALVGAALLVLSIWRPDPAGPVRRAAVDVVAPAGKAGAATRVNGGNFFDAIAGYFRAGSQNAELAEQLDIARVRLEEAKAVEAENRRLKAALGLHEELQDPVVAARLVGATSSSTRRIAYLAAGSRDGVKPGMPVRSALGLVGRVLDVGRNNARVLLLSDNESMVPVRRAKDDVIAFAEGRGDGTIRLRLVNLGINPIEEGDVFVTSGAGGMFPPGIAVAVAAEKTSDGALARVISDPAATDFVIVEQMWQRDVLESPVAAAPAPGDPE